MLLIEYTEKEIWRGTVFRFLAKHPFDEIVDFMLMEYSKSESGFAIYCISGYYAGCMESILPKEAINTENNSLSTQWTIENFNKWICMDCPIDKVEIIIN